MGHLEPVPSINVYDSLMILSLYCSLFCLTGFHSDLLTYLIETSVRGLFRSDSLCFSSSADVTGELANAKDDSAEIV